MTTCDTCGNDYDKTFTVTRGDVSGTFDSFECAAQAMAPQCAHCGCRILGHGVEAYALVKLAQSDPDWRTRLIEQLQAFDEVISCQAMTGECDLLVHIVASDIEAYGEFAMQRLLTLPGVADMRSSFVLATIKPDRGWPI